MRLKVPHTLVLLFSMILIAQLLTWILPRGEYERQTNEAGGWVLTQRALIFKLTYRLYL